MESVGCESSHRPGAGIAELEAALAAALNGSPIETPDLLAALDEAFETHVPEALRAQFEPAREQIATMIDGGA